MTDVKSKNLYELLGNTSDQDSDREPAPPTKAIDKPSARSGKRDAPKTAPEAPVGGTRGGRTGRGDRTGGFNASETAFRDRQTGRDRNRQVEGPDGGEKRRERGRGRGGPRRGGDRHSRAAVGDHQKQVGHGWGEQTGDGEWADEKAGEKMANQERKDAANDGDDGKALNEDGKPVDITEGGVADDADAEPEDTSKSYAEYLAEKAAAKLEGLGLKEARAPNEGSKEDKKWKSAKALERNDEEAYFQGEEKARRERERGRNAKERVDIDYSFKEQARETRGGGRGGPRGRGRGGDRGDRGERPERGERGERGDRGDFRGRGRGGRGEGRGGRGEGRGARGGAAPRGGPVAVNDQEAFPSLGSK